MGSGHSGEVSLGKNGKSGSSRKGKKSSSSNNGKPKQLQRGLGVAQLEKMRLHDQMASYLPNSLHHHPPFHHTNMNREEIMSTATSSSVFAFQCPNNTMMGFGEVDRRFKGFRFGEIQSGYTARPFLYHDTASSPNYGGQEAFTPPLLERNTEGSTEKKRRHDRRLSTGSTSQNSDSADVQQELDLDLKLSL